MSTFSPALFNPGELTSTPGVQDLVEKGLNVLALFRRHIRGDWGDITEEDRAENQLSLEKGYRLLSSYKTEFGAVWIITEADRSYSTALLPDEY